MKTISSLAEHALALVLALLAVMVIMFVFSGWFWLPVMAGLLHGTAAAAAALFGYVCITIIVLAVYNEVFES